MAAQARGGNQSGLNRLGSTVKVAKMTNATPQKEMAPTVSAVGAIKKKQKPLQFSAKSTANQAQYERIVNMLRISTHMMARRDSALRGRPARGLGAGFDSAASAFDMSPSRN